MEWQFGQVQSRATVLGHDDGGGGNAQASRKWAGHENAAEALMFVWRPCFETEEEEGGQGGFCRVRAGKFSRSSEEE